MLSLVATFGGLVLAWLRSAAKWLGTILFNEKTGLVTHWFDRQCEMMEAIQEMPKVVSVLMEHSKNDTLLMKAIQDNQVGENAHPRILHEKLDLVIEAEICDTEAMRFFLAGNNPEAERCLDKAEELYTRARNL